MAAPISNDQEEARIAELLKSRIKERAYTHESFAAAVGVHPSRVSQWATNRGGVPPERAQFVAGLLGLTPDVVSLSWRRLRDEFQASQHSRLDATTIRAAIILAKESFRLGADEELVIERDPEAFAQALRTAIAARQQMEANGDFGSGSGDGETGAVGGVEGAPEAGETPRPKASRKRTRVANG